MASPSPSRDIKTADQLRREIAYFAMILQSTRSRDRLRRAHVAIRKREGLLIKATAIERQQSESSRG